MAEINPSDPQSANEYDDLVALARFGEWGAGSLEKGTFVEVEGELLSAIQHLGAIEHKCRSRASLENLRDMYRAARFVRFRQLQSGTHA